MSVVSLWRNNRMDLRTTRTYALCPYATSVLSFGERRAVRIFPLVRTWALVQQNRASPSNANAHAAVWSRVMRLRVVGVLALVLRFAY